jgi:disulfide bond formation protein DsbB
MTVEATNYVLALGTLAMQIIGVGLLGVYFLRLRSKPFADVGESLAQWGMLLAFILAALGSGLTVYYSGILGILPCPLCWWQRAFLYPQVALFVIALWKRDTRIADYSIVLSVIGLGIALYQHALQVMPAGVLPCPAVAEGVSCAQRIVFEFNYITFPFMAATLFGFLIVLMLFVRRR